MHEKKRIIDSLNKGKEIQLPKTSAAAENGQSFRKT